MHLTLHQIRYLLKLVGKESQKREAIIEQDIPYKDFLSTETLLEEAVYYNEEDETKIGKGLGYEEIV